VKYAVRLLVWGVMTGLTSTESPSSHCLVAFLWVWTLCRNGRAERAICECVVWLFVSKLCGSCSYTQSQGRVDSFLQVCLCEGQKWMQGRDSRCE
jgi:hypothetical protein